MELQPHKMDGKSFPTLYKKNSKGKVQFWKISVIPNPDDSVAYDIYVNHGQEGGKEQTSVDTIFEGKNIGKANETSVLQQAISEAESKWTKQQERKGYKQDRAKLDMDERPGVEPMLAHRYDKYPDKIEFPCYIQPKLDGHRCLAIVKDGKCELFSRQRKPITGLPHIIAAIESLGLTNIILDGELYNHDYKDNFEDLTGFIRSETPKNGHEAVQYHMYDVSINLDYSDRYKILWALAEKILISETFNILQCVQTIECIQSEVVPHFKDFVSQGYEGAILRNFSGKYEGKRSYNLQKVKEFEDAEFEIVGVEEGRGSMKGHAIFVCEVGENTFKAKMKGEMDHLVEIFNNKDQYIGKTLTVQFQGLTKEGIPRFPVGLRVREDA